MTSARLVGWLATAALVLTLVLAHSRLNGPPCLFRTAFGVPCPGCGITRSLEALWRGEFLLAVRYHPLGPAVFALLAGVAVWSLAFGFVPRWRGALERFARPFRHAAWAWTALALLLLAWVVRLLDAVLHGGVFLW